MGRLRIKELQKVECDRKIVEGLRLGKSLTSLQKQSGKSKGYVIKIKDLALEYGYIEKFVSEEKGVSYRATKKNLPNYPEALFIWKDRRSEQATETDALLEPKREWIIERLNTSWSPQTIFEELEIAVPRSNFYRYLRRHGLKKEKDPAWGMELIHSPGECLQLDWGKLFDVRVAGKKKAIWVLIGTLGHSRLTVARVVEKLDFETTINVLTEMLEELGGVPQKLIIDNPKVFVLEALKARAPVKSGL